jgi:hypothetical protein
MGRFTFLVTLLNSTRHCDPTEDAGTNVANIRHPCMVISSIYFYTNHVILQRHGDPTVKDLRLAFGKKCRRFSETLLRPGSTVSNNSTVAA